GQIQKAFYRRNGTGRTRNFDRQHGERRPDTGGFAESLRAGHPPDPRMPGGTDAGRTESADTAIRKRRHGALRRRQRRNGRRMNDSFDAYLDHCRHRVNAAMAEQVGSPQSEYSTTATQAWLQRLFEAMGYSLLIGGKRVRPTLVYAAAQAISNRATNETLDAIACAVEFIHTYSLVHDDLPAMDDDDLRRGSPTCHKQFDEATAILAGDGLQARAFELLAELPVDAELRIRLITTLAAASGARGMVGGQAIDLGAVQQK